MLALQRIRGSLTIMHYINSLTYVLTGSRLTDSVGLLETSLKHSTLRSMVETKKLAYYGNILRKEKCRGKRLYLITG